MTDKNLTFEISSYDGCGDPMTCTHDLGEQTLPFASRNTPTVVFLGSNPYSVTSALTAPAWAFARMYNSKLDSISLPAMKFGPSYTIPASVKSTATIPFSHIDDGYATITITNGAITSLQ